MHGNFSEQQQCVKDADNIKKILYNSYVPWNKGKISPKRDRREIETGIKSDSGRDVREICHYKR